MAITTKQINVNRKAWDELKNIIASMINPRLIEASDLSDSQTSVYLLKVLNEFIKISNKKNSVEEPEKSKMGFSREY